MPAKPIHVFYSPLSGRFYASAHYRVDETNGTVTITGRKYDVTNDIAAAIEEYDIEFSRAAHAEREGGQDGR